jgi:hypothetical protein
MYSVIWLGPVLVRLEIGPPSSSHIVTVAAVLLPAAVGRHVVKHSRVQCRIGVPRRGRTCWRLAAVQLGNPCLVRRILWTVLLCTSVYQQGAQVQGHSIR